MFCCTLNLSDQEHSTCANDKQQRFEGKNKKKERIFMLFFFLFFLWWFFVSIELNLMFANHSNRCFNDDHFGSGNSKTNPFQSIVATQLNSDPAFDSPSIGMDFDVLL